MTHDSSLVRDTSNLFAMDQGAARPVRLPPKANAVKQLTNTQRDELEHQLHCQCGCTLDVFTCRTTDFSCQVSPAMHRDVMALVDGGYSAQEIIDAFVVDVRRACADGAAAIRIQPARVGLAGNRRARRRRVHPRVVSGARSRRGRRRSAPAAKGVDATDDELARLEAAIRRDGE